MRKGIILGVLLAASFIYAPTVFALELNFESVDTYGTTGSVDSIQKIAFDSQGNKYILGSFSPGTIDFDKTEGVDEQTNSSGTGSEPFLSKYNADGTYAWTKKWGGTGGNDFASDSAFDSDDNVYVTGEFWTTVDFDPGPGTDEFTSAGSVDFHLTRYNADGTYAWTKKWGDTGPDRAPKILINDNDDIFFGSDYRLTIDFDAGAGVATSTSNGNYDAYLMRYDTDGNYVWHRTWGGVGIDAVSGIQEGSNGDLYLSGRWAHTVDFDPGPGPGTDEKTAVGNDFDAFIAKYDIDGNYIWSRVWGAADHDYAHDIFVDSEDNVFVMGGYRETVDFDPGAGSAEHTAVGEEDAYLAFYNTDGEFDRVYVWGGIEVDQYYTMRESDDKYYIAGMISGDVDFDFGIGTHLVGPEYGFVNFVSVYDEDFEHLTTITYGQTTDGGFWYSNGISDVHIREDDLYVYGSFSETNDFDPNPSAEALRTSLGGTDSYISIFTIDTSVAEEESEEEEEEPRSQSSQKGTTIQGQVKNLQKQGKTDEANALMQKWHWLFDTNDAEGIRAKQIAALIVELQKLIVLAEALGLTLNPLAYDLVGSR